LKNDLDSLKICQKSLSEKESDEIKLNELLDEIIERINKELLFYKSEKKKVL
jgi:hypothetical protein